ncbi:MAG: hypothetical protein WBD87_10810 [Candidatus Acidiferrales bacterium]
MKATSELAFESFLDENKLPFKKIEEFKVAHTKWQSKQQLETEQGQQLTRRPDYLVQIGDVKLMFEIKELARDKDFAGGNRTIGGHVRRKIKEARGQLRYATAQGIPAVLLIYNDLDREFSFGTEDHDFIAAIYGGYTLAFDRSTGARVDAFHGRNQSMREEWNTEFSAVGRLKRSSERMVVTLFENVFSQVNIPYEKLPACFDVIRVKISA